MTLMAMHHRMDCARCYASHYCLTAAPFWVIELVVYVIAQSSSCQAMAPKKKAATPSNPTRKKNDSPIAKKRPASTPSTLVKKKQKTGKGGGKEYNPFDHSPLVGQTRIAFNTRPSGSADPAPASPANDHSPFVSQTPIAFNTKVRVRPDNYMLAVLNKMSQQGLEKCFDMMQNHRCLSEFLSFKAEQGFPDYDPCSLNRKDLAMHPFQT